MWKQERKRQNTQRCEQGGQKQESQTSEMEPFADMTRGAVATEVGCGREVEVKASSRESQRAMRLSRCWVHGGSSAVWGGV